MKKAVLITGGAKRIGAFTAIKLAEEGYDIALHYNSSERDAILTRSRVKSLGRECSLYKGDLRDMNFIPELIRAVFDNYPYLSVLINSASVFKRADISDTSVQIFDEMMNVNFKAPFFLIKEFTKFCDEGNIINILDTKTAKYQNVYAAYIISRTALKELTAMAAVEFAPGIRCNGICPGLILPDENDDEEYVKRLESRNLLGRKGGPDNVSSAVMFLLNNSFVTGQTIFVDGGENIK